MSFTAPDPALSVDKIATCSLTNPSVKSRSALAFPAHAKLPLCLAITRFTFDVLLRRSRRRAGSSSFALSPTK